MDKSPQRTSPPKVAQNKWQLNLDVRCSAKWIKGVHGLYHRTTYQTGTLFCGFTPFSRHNNPQWINVIQFWASIAPMISMIKWQCHSCYYYYCYHYYFFIIVIIISIIIIIFMMCRFNEYAGFTWSSCHTGVVRFLLDGCYGRWFVYVKQRTESWWPLRAGGTCILLRTSFVDMNTGRHWVLIVDQIREISLMQWPEPVR